MLILFRGEMAKPYGMKDEEFFGVWCEEAQAALAAEKAGAIKGIWKVAGKFIVIGLIELNDINDFDGLLFQLPVFKKGYTFLNKLDYDVLVPYDGWSKTMQAVLDQAKKQGS